MSESAAREPDGLTFGEGEVLGVALGVLDGFVEPLEELVGWLGELGCVVGAGEPEAVDEPVGFGDGECFFGGATGAWAPATRSSGADPGFSVLALAVLPQSFVPCLMPDTATALVGALPQTVVALPVGFGAEAAPILAGAEPGRLEPVVGVRCVFPPVPAGPTAAVAVGGRSVVGSAVGRLPPVFGAGAANGEL